LPKTLKHHSVLFADDVSLLFKCPTKNHNISCEITQALTDIKLWLYDHCLELNTQKTKIIQFKPYQKTPLDLHTLTIKTEIQEVNEVNLLGLKLDSGLNWKGHVEHLKVKLSRFVYALSVIKRNTSVECARSAYHAYAYAWLRYGVVLWGHSVNAHDIFIMQKKCLRIIVNIRQPESCKNHFVKQNILTLPSIYILEIGMFVRKHMYLFEFVKSTRRQNKLVIPESKLNMFKQGPYYRSIKIYNNIPDYIKTEVKDTIFCTKLKNYLMEKAYYSVQEFMADTV
jgi:hypothetical protein